MMPQFDQSTPSINSSSSSQPKETVSELDSETSNKINMKCLNILLEYEQMQNLDVSILYLSYVNHNV